MVKFMSDVIQEGRRAGKKLRKIDKIKSALGESVEDVEDASGQSSKSVRLSYKKKMLDMKDGDEHFDVGVTSVGPINELFAKIKLASLYPSVVTLNIPTI
jgi:hypothetical protein